MIDINDHDWIVENRVDLLTNIVNSVITERNLGRLSWEDLAILYNKNSDLHSFFNSACNIWDYLMDNEPNRVIKD